ncbi:MAG: sensor histidine kinase, partial [Chloroflexota bacterium]
ELALCNLLDNALKFTPSSGQISVTAHRIHLEQEPNAVAKTGIRFSIKDSGPGIPSKEKDFIFDRFYRGQHQTQSGSGLGLAIVQRITQMHLGHVWVEQNKDQDGSCFNIDIPDQNGEI